MKQAALSFLLIFLTSCGHYEQKCGAYVDKWRDGRSGVVAIDCGGTTYSAFVNDAAYANAKKGDQICINMYMHD